MRTTLSWTLVPFVGATVVALVLALLTVGA